jgi:hypothetical protein
VRCWICTIRPCLRCRGQILPAFVFTSVDALMKTLVSDDATSIIGRVYTVQRRCR